MNAGCGKTNPGVEVNRTVVARTEHRRTPGAEWAGGDEPGRQKSHYKSDQWSFLVSRVNTFICTFNCFLNIIELIILLGKISRLRLHAVHRRLLGVILLHGVSYGEDRRIQ